MFETLLKVATGLALNVSKKDIMRAVGDFQYGALMAAGAEPLPNPITYSLRQTSKTPSGRFSDTKPFKHSSRTLHYLLPS